MLENKKLELKLETEDFDETGVSRERGKRAEEVAEWYFRLNGFFLIHGFIVHPDRQRLKPRTEADLLGIRLKESSEGVWRTSKGDHFRPGVNRTSMTDDALITKASMDGTVKKHLIAMVEVKAGKCSINGPWSDIDERDQQLGGSNMERALSRVGFGNKTEISTAALSMYESLRYQGANFIVQYFSVGKYVSAELDTKYPKLVQITYDQIAIFLRDRFNGFPEKIPHERDISLWEGFGDSFRWWFESNGYRKSPSVDACKSAVSRYIEKGKC
jgi:hypothetical protein